MHFNIITLFPEVFEPYLSTSLLGNAREKSLLEIKLYQLRDYADDKHRTVDDTPYGGGAGLILKIEPIDQALQAIKKDGATDKNHKTVLLSARGQQFTGSKAKNYAQLSSLTLICGRYEGIDQRVSDHLADEEISIGPYVLAGGELPALIVLESTARFIPGMLGNPDSLAEESYNSGSNEESNKYQREYPQYTKPAEYRGWRVPEVLRSGDHQAIKKWRQDNSQSHR